MVWVPYPSASSSAEGGALVLALAIALLVDLKPHQMTNLEVPGSSHTALRPVTDWRTFPNLRTRTLPLGHKPTSCRDDQTPVQVFVHLNRRDYERTALSCQV